MKNTHHGHHKIFKNFSEKSERIHVKKNDLLLLYRIVVCYLKYFTHKVKNMKVDQKNDFTFLL